MAEPNSEFFTPTPILDSDHPRVAAFAEKCLHGVANDPVARAVALYYAVRDDIWYDPYSPFFLPEHYRASVVLKRGRGYCVSKASLLCALGRAGGIASRIGFATVRNHLATRQLIEFLGSDLFVYHGFTEFYLNGQWVKATPAFNIELCDRFGVAPLEFDGRSDSIFHAFNTEDKPFMEYLAQHGSFADVPVAEILAAWETTYGVDRVRQWIAAYDQAGASGRDFDSEEAI
ncbi:MAG: transglutaminase family protein [Desulfobacterales bacterium]|nr:transglutaminase family protein [Desulfobacterales bacterium]